MIGTGDDPWLRTHEIGALLAEGAEIAVIVTLFTEHPESAGVGYTWPDVYTDGTTILTHGSIEDPWFLGDTDLYFEAHFSTCHADINGDGVLSILDFVAFQSAFAAGSGEADCDGDWELTVLDFVCFQAAFQAGCGAD